MPSNTSKHLKIAITGAAGQVGYAFLFQLLIANVFPKNTILELRLFDLPAKIDALHGIAMELEDCAFENLGNVVVADNIETAMRDADVIVLIGAVPRGPNMQRVDLLRSNAVAMKECAVAINNVAAKDAKVLVVGNPCNTNCLVVSKHAARIPAANFYAMTMLDSKRAKFQLAAKAKVAISDVSEVAVWGNHSATQYPDFYNARIKGELVTNFIDLPWLQTEFLKMVRERGAAIIKKRGASSGGSAAYSAVETLRYIFNNAPQGENFSLACMAHGEYGVDDGLIFSFPCSATDGKIKIITGFEHNDFAREQLAQTLAELRSERDLVHAAGLL